MNQKNDDQLAKIFQAAAKSTDSPAERDKTADALNKFLKQLNDEDLKKALKSVFAFLQARRKALRSGILPEVPFAAIEKLYDAKSQRIITITTASI